MGDPNVANFIVHSAELPEGFFVTHLISLDPDWQANLRNDEHVAVGTGATPEEAIAAAAAKVELDQFVGRLFHLPYSRRHQPEQGLTLAALGLAQTKPLLRRKL